MSRTAPCHYIDPSAFSITPNANGTASDIAVSVVRGARISIFSNGIPEIGFVGGTYNSWSLSGRNRRLADDTRPYTVYARLSKTDHNDGYIVFSPKTDVSGEWVDSYPYVGMDGLVNPGGTPALATWRDYWWIRLGDVSLPSGGERQVTIDTGILGTDQFNTEWNLDPDDMPMRVELSSTIDDEDAGPTPFVPWDKALALHATLVEGWSVDASGRIDHWTIERNSGNASADAAWNQAHAAAFLHTGDAVLRHLRTGSDDFAGVVSVVFTVTAWGEEVSQDGGSSGSGNTETVRLSSSSITILSETIERYELVRSADLVSYNPPSDTYSPAEGIDVTIRSVDQKGTVTRITNAQFAAAGLSVEYRQSDSATWVSLAFTGATGSVAMANIPASMFHSRQGLSLRLLSASRDELHTATIAFVRDGDDSKEREWIFLRSQSPIIFGGASSEHPMPSLIAAGEVNPTGAATGDDTDKNQDGWVPEGWWDDPQGTSENSRYEYGAYRDFHHGTDGTSGNEPSGNYWGAFSVPRIWSYYGDDAVTYRCRWTLDGTEVWQLVASYTGDFKGTLPLVATLMKRKGNGEEEAVTASESSVTVSCDGCSYSVTENIQNPRFVISESSHHEFIPYLNNVDMTGLSITFLVGGESFSFSIPVIREADEDSVKETVEEHGAGLFLSRLYDDIAEGNMRFERNVTIDGILRALAEIISNRIQSDNFSGDGAFDSGFRMMKDPADGVTSLVVDNLFVRMKAIFTELEIRKISYAGGNIIFSHAGSRIVMVRTVDGGVWNGSMIWNGSNVWPSAGNVYRCYVMADDGTTRTENWWRVGDQARCETFNIKDGVYQNVSNQSYWRLVTGVGSEEIDGKMYDFVDLSVSDCMEGSTAPQAGDQIVQMGHRTDASRQGFIAIEVSGENAPAFKVYKGVAGYSLSGKRKICLSPAHSDLRVQSLTIETEYDTQRVPMERGAWSSIADHRCYYYDVVQHNGASWLCVVAEGTYTTDEPSKTSEAWMIYAEKGEKGDDGKDITIAGRAVTTNILTPAYPQQIHEEGAVVLLINNTDDISVLTDGTWETQDVEEGVCYICDKDGHLYEKKSDGWHDMGQFQGDDAVNVVVTPAAIIVNQDLNNPANLASLSGDAAARSIITVLCGNSELYVTDVNISSRTHCNATVGVSQGKGYIQLTAVTTHSVSGSNIFYDSGDVTASVTYTVAGVSKTVTGVKVNFYANLLGTWKETVEEDTKHAVATSTLYDLFGQGFSQTDNIGDYIQSSTENISQLRKDITIDYYSEAVAPLDYAQMKAIVFHGKAGTYHIHAEIDNSDDPSGQGYSFYLHKVGSSASPQSIGAVDDSILDTTFSISEEGDYYITFEDGFESQSGEVDSISVTYQEAIQSVVRQQADEIRQIVADKASKSEVTQTANEITAKVVSLQNGKNLIPVLSGWSDYNGGDIDYDIVNMGVADSGYDLLSPIITGYSGETYCFSAYVKSSAMAYLTSNLYVYHALTYSDAADIVDNGAMITVTSVTQSAESIMVDGVRHYRFFFTIPVTTAMNAHGMVVECTQDEVLYHPQLELGTYPTVFVANADEVREASAGYADIKANEVRIGVQDDLYDTGVDIVSKIITLKADKTLFQDNNGNDMISVEMYDGLPSIVFYDGGGVHNGNRTWILNYNGLASAIQSAHQYFWTSTVNCVGFQSDDVLSVANDLVGINTGGYHQGSVYNYHAAYGYANGTKVYSPPQAEDCDGVWYNSNAVNANTLPIDTTDTVSGWHIIEYMERTSSWITMMLVYFVDGVKMIDYNIDLTKNGNNQWVAAFDGQSNLTTITIPAVPAELLTPPSGDDDNNEIDNGEGTDEPANGETEEGEPDPNEIDTDEDINP